MLSRFTDFHQAGLSLANLMSEYGNKLELKDTVLSAAAQNINKDVCLSFFSAKF